MQWQKVREHYPNQWLVVEALAAHTDTGKRVLDELAVVDSFPDSSAALGCYRELHREAPNRELFVLHTSREEPNVRVRQWLGIRTAR